MFYRLLLLLGLAFCGTAIAQAVANTAGLAGMQPATVTMLVIVGSSMLAHWFTALTKARFGTEGRVTQLLAGFFSAVFGGYVTYVSGSYGHGWPALGISLLVSLVTWAAADAQWQGKVQAATAALKGVQQSGGLPSTVLPTSPATADPTPVPPPPVNPAPAETAAPSPASVPAIDAALVFTGDPMNLKLLTLLSGALSLSTSTPTAGQATALATWADQTLPILRADVEAIGTNFSMPALIKLANDTMLAANKLEAAFEGLDRAEVVAVTVRFVAQTFAPPAAQAWLGPILSSGVLENLIESLYRERFPAAVTAPVVNAPELPSGAAVTQ